MLVIGSTAIKYHFPDFKRTPKDVDFAVNSLTENRSTQQIEYLVNPIIAVEDDTSHPPEFASPDLLYTLKMSHVVGWNINWEKHVFDIQFLRSKGCKLDRELFFKLYGYWNTVHTPNRRSDLEMTSEQFFNNAVKCEHDHDFLHTLLNPCPTFTKVLKDGAEVEVCEDKFNNLAHEDKCNLVREEVEVMAWERFSNFDYRVAYSKMLKKFILNHAPLWEAIFIVENYVELSRPNRNYFKIIENAVIRS